MEKQEKNIELGHNEKKSNNEISSIIFNYHEEIFPNNIYKSLVAYEITRMDMISDMQLKLKK